MKYVVEMGSDAVIYITKFHKDWFRHSKVNGWRDDSQTHKYHGDCISLLLFFQNKESRPKIESTPRAFRVGVRLKPNPFNLNYVGGQKPPLKCILCKFPV
jgi:hypothetical protein